MKHPQTRKPRWRPCGSGVTQLLPLPKSGHVCALREGMRGRGAWIIPAGESLAPRHPVQPAGRAVQRRAPRCRSHQGQELRAQGQVPK